MDEIVICSFTGHDVVRIIQFFIENQVINKQSLSLKCIYLSQSTLGSGSTFFDNFLS